MKMSVYLWIFIQPLLHLRMNTPFLLSRLSLVIREAFSAHAEVRQTAVHKAGAPHTEDRGHHSTKS